jgi:hypothetical protein
VRPSRDAPRCATGGALARIPTVAWTTRTKFWARKVSIWLMPARTLPAAKSHHRPLEIFFLPDRADVKKKPNEPESRRNPGEWAISTGRTNPAVAAAKGGTRHPPADRTCAASPLADWSIAADPAASSNAKTPHPEHAGPYLLTMTCRIRRFLLHAGGVFARILSSMLWPRLGISMVRLNSITRVPSALWARVAMVTMPWVGRDLLGRLSSTSDSA